MPEHSQGKDDDCKCYHASLGCWGAQKVLADDILEVGGPGGSKGGRGGGVVGSGMVGFLGL